MCDYLSQSLLLTPNIERAFYHLQFSFVRMRSLYTLRIWDESVLIMETPQMCNEFKERMLAPKLCTNESGMRSKAARYLEPTTIDCDNYSHHVQRTKRRFISRSRQRKYMCKRRSASFTCKLTDVVIVVEITKIRFQILNSLRGRDRHLFVNIEG